MRDWCDNPQLEEIFLEQSTIFPNSPLGTLMPVGMEQIADIPPPRRC